MTIEEQNQKIERLRQEREAERSHKNKVLNWLNGIATLKYGLDINDPVFLTKDGKTISGYVVKKHKDGTYNVKTPYGIIQTSADYRIRKRYVEDLSGVIIPDELKTFHTTYLLKLLNWYRRGHTEVLKDGTILKREQIKAELKNRPHIPTKREKNTFSKK
jgi:hypothetical protein